MFAAMCWCMLGDKRGRERTKKKPAFRFFSPCFSRSAVDKDETTSKNLFNNLLFFLVPSHGLSRSQTQARTTTKPTRIEPRAFSFRTNEIATERNESALFAFVSFRSLQLLSFTVTKKNTRSSAAADAYDDLEGIVIDDRKWRVDWANESDFKFFNWSWFEGGEEDKGRSGKGGGSRNPSPSLSSEKHGGGGSPVHENESKDRYD